MMFSQDLKQSFCDFLVVYEWVRYVRVDSQCYNTKSEKDVRELDEFEWEKMLRESDQRTDKFQELFEKYEDHPDRDQIIVKEMGWDKHAEHTEDGDEKWLEDPNISLPESDWDESAFPDDDDIDLSHPLVEEVTVYSIRLWRDYNVSDDTTHDAISSMVFNVQTLGSKLAGALTVDYSDPGLAVALLKRAMVYLNDCLKDLQTIADEYLIPESDIEAIRDRMFQFREEIINLMESFRRQSCP
jgi:hypothetical protein